MISLGEILSVAGDEEFGRAALELFRFQSAECTPYREYVSLMGVDPESVDSVDKIPFLPIRFFRSRKVYCGLREPEITFTSSGTGSQWPSKHHVAYVSDYVETFRRAFSLFYPGERHIYALLPSYLEREGSSLVYMANDLIRSHGGGFYLDEYDKLIGDMGRDPGPKILLGVSYALWDLAEKYSLRLHDTVVMETGGMKGRREELSKEDFHALLCKAFSVKSIASEYGMAELMSQAYSSGDGIFYAPPWMRVSVGDLNDPFVRLGTGQSGRVNIIDLANRFSCAFLATDDVGRMGADGSFEILGRADRSVIRGCNLLVQ